MTTSKLASHVRTLEKPWFFLGFFNIFTVWPTCKNMSKYITKYLSKYLKIHPKTVKNVKNRVQKLKNYLQVSIFLLTYA